MRRVLMTLPTSDLCVSGMRNRLFCSATFVASRFMEFTECRKALKSHFLSLRQKQRLTREEGMGGGRERVP